MTTGKTIVLTRCTLVGKVMSLLLYMLSRLKIINSSALRFLYGPTLTSIHDYWKNHSLARQAFVGKMMSLLSNMLSRFVIAFLPKRKCPFFGCSHSPSAVILEPKEINSVMVSIVSPSICQEVIRPDAMIFVFWMLSFKTAFSLSSRSSLVPLHFLP